MGPARADGAARSRRWWNDPPTQSIVDEGQVAASRPWTPRIAMQLAVLAAAAFIYVTAEILPVGALPAIARGLHVSVPMVGTLLAWYALVAAVTTIPLVRWTAHWPRRRALLLSLACLTASPADLGGGTQLRRAGRRPSALGDHARPDAVGPRTDRHPAGPGQPFRPRDNSRSTSASAWRWWSAARPRRR